MSTLVTQLLAQLQGQPLQQMAQKLDISPTQAGSAVSAALPAMLNALAGHAQTAGGAQTLLGALKQAAGSSGSSDLGGLLGGALGGLLGGGNASGAQAAGGLLENLLGSAEAKTQAQERVSLVSGLSADKAGQLLQMLAPVVMGFLSKQAGGKLDAGSLGQLLGSLTGGAANGGASGGLLTGVLDQNGDGKLDAGDLLKLGSQLLGGKK